MNTAKNIMDEGSPRYIGTYVGGASQPHVKISLNNLTV